MPLTRLRACVALLCAWTCCALLTACSLPRASEQSMPAALPSVGMDHSPEGLVRAIWSFCPNRIGQACAFITQRLGDDPQDPAWVGLDLECRAVWAIAAEQQSRPAPAHNFGGLVQTVRGALLEKPGSTQQQRALGLGLLLDGQVPAARQTLNAALDMSPRSPYSRLAQTLAAGQDQARMAALLHSQEADLAALPAYWLTTAWQAELTGRFLEAEAAYRRALASDSRNTAAMIGLARLEMDAPQTQAVAAERFAQVLAINNADEVALFNLALIRMREGQQDQAMGHVRRLLELHPRDVAAWDLRGLILRSLGRNQEAEVSFRTAVSLNPRLAAPFYNLGALCAENLIDDSCAIEAFARFLDLEPEGPRSEQVRAWLREAASQRVEGKGQTPSAGAEHVEDGEHAPEDEKRQPDDGEQE